MIYIDNLSFTYPGAKKPILKNISLNIEDGDFVAIVGNNGCGKSTLCKTLNGLIPHFFNGDFEGKVLVNGKNTLEHNVGELAMEVGYVYQDFENQIVRPTAIDDASYACLNYAMADYLERGKEALDMVGMLDKQDEYIWQLSGGQKHLLALAGMVALKPNTIILDEPIAQLDPSHAKKIYDVLKDLNNKGITIIVIEHHTEFIAEYCKSVIMMCDGEVKWKLPASSALNRVDELINSNIFPPQVTIAARELSNYGYKKDTKKLPTTLSEGEQYFNKLSFKLCESIKEENPTDKDRECLVEFSNVAIEYRTVKGDNYKAIDELDLRLYKGEKIALIGNNGAGKSTLMKLMIGLLKPKCGAVKVKGIDTKDTIPEKMSQIISLVYQNPEEMFIKDTIRSDIEYAMKVRDVENYEKRTKELIDMFNLDELKDRDGRLLSGGQMRRASLAIGIALNPSILLLDEPTANLDIATRKEIIKTLNVLKNQVETAVIATHDMQLVAEWADRIIVLSSGKVVGDGTRNEVFSNKNLVELSGIKPPDIFIMGTILDPRSDCYTISEFVTSFQEEEVV